jgi:hypothetical protein
VIDFPRSIRSDLRFINHLFVESLARDARSEISAEFPQILAGFCAHS